MLTSIQHLLGRSKEPSSSPPPVTITGVRIPADGTPAHLLSLTTISDNRSTDGFLFHVPNLRHYWKSEQAWELRDLHRLDLQHHIPQQHELRQQHDLRQILRYHARGAVPIHLRQRHLHEQQYHLLQQHYCSSKGAYYVFYSFAVDDLPENSHVPAWIRDLGDSNRQNYYGDVFLAKMAPHEFDDHDWAAYEDITPEFLDLLVTGPSCRLEKDIASLYKKTRA